MFYALSACATNKELPAPQSSLTEAEIPVEKTKTPTSSGIVSNIQISDHPHLKDFLGNAYLQNDYYQIIFAEVNPQRKMTDWTPLILRIFVKEHPGSWVASSCLKEMFYRRNWTSSPLPTTTLATIPSTDSETGQARIDVVFEVNPGKPKKEFLQVVLREGDPRMYFVTDHLQFEKQRTQMESRVSFRAFIKSTDFFNSPDATSTAKVERYRAFAFACEQQVWSFAATGAFRAKYSADESFEFHTTGRNKLGWESFFVSAHPQVARQLHLQSYIDKTCAIGPKGTVSETISDLATCTAIQKLPKLNVVQPVDNPSKAPRCVKLQDANKQELSRGCFGDGEAKFSFRLEPNTAYYAHDMLTGQSWGGEAGIKLNEAESEDIFLPSAPPAPRE